MWYYCAHTGWKSCEKAFLFLAQLVVECFSMVVVVVVERLGTAWKVAYLHTSLKVARSTKPWFGSLTLVLLLHINTLNKRKQGVFVWSLFIWGYKWIKSAENKPRPGGCGRSKTTECSACCQWPATPALYPKNETIHNSSKGTQASWRSSWEVAYRTCLKAK